MKKLTRTASNFLSGLTVATTDWMDAPKEDIWKKLEKMQNGFCAYCECKLIRKHIEHFKTRGQYPKETYNWDNLFGSCGDSSKAGGWERCGIYKDNNAAPYNINHIIKPDVDNPNDYLLFLTTGKITPKPTLAGDALHKAKETIRVLHLNGDSRLYNSRKNAIAAIQHEIDELYELQEDLGKDWQDLLNDSLNNVLGQEFQTALEHAWCYNQAYET